MSDAITAPNAIHDELQRRLMVRTAKILPGGYEFMPRMRRVVCADGFNVSVQAHEGAYCAPRQNRGPWRHVELGFPSAPLPELAKYCDAPEEQAATATVTVWGYVPLSKVAEVLAAHGGLMPEADDA